MKTYIKFIPLQPRSVKTLEGSQILKALIDLPEKIEYTLSRAEQIKSIAQEFAEACNFLYLGRGYNFPVALEGALKLKEISYIHAEGHPAAEMKHGPIALIDHDMPVVFIAPSDDIYDKIISTIQPRNLTKSVTVERSMPNQRGFSSSPLSLFPSTSGVLSWQRMTITLSRTGESKVTSMMSGRF